MPPVQPMLAKSVKGIPDPAKFDGGLSFEPKWDGFRCIVFKDGDEVELTSRNTKPLTRYFPEVVAAIREQLPERCVLDGELFVAIGPRLEFEVLQERIHPAESRINMLAEKTPASFVAFDVLAFGDESLRRPALLGAARAAGGGARRAHRSDVPHPHDDRRRRGRRAGSRSSRAPGSTAWWPSRWGRRTSRTRAPCSRSSTSAPPTWWWRATGCTRPRRRRSRCSARCCSGCTPTGSSSTSGSRPRSPAARRAELLEELSRWSATSRTTRGASGRNGRSPTPTGCRARRAAGAPARTCRSRRCDPSACSRSKYDAMEGRRFRHTAQFKRWRPDRDPESCGYEQLEQPVSYDLTKVLGMNPSGGAS